MAYCLLGLFNISMPLLYGEGTKAFRRFQEKIIKTSNDTSIFAWTNAAEDVSAPTSQSILAISPIFFADSGKVTRRFGPDVELKPYAVTNNGLEMNVNCIGFPDLNGFGLTANTFGRH